MQDAQPTEVPVVTPPTEVVPAVEPVVQPVEPVVAPVLIPVEPVVQPTVEPVVAPVPEPSLDIAPSPTPPMVNTALDAAASILTSNGIDAQAVLDKALGEGLSDSDHAAIEAAVGREQSLLLLSTLNTAVATAQTEVSDLKQTVYDAAGGQAEWTAIQEWTRTPEAKLDAAAAEEYSTMLQLGGVQAQLAVKALKEAYMASPGFNTGVPAVQPTGAVPPTASVEAISRPQYIEQRSKAVREGNATAVEQLDNRARQTMDKAPQMWRVQSIIN